MLRFHDTATHLPSAPHSGEYLANPRALRPAYLPQSFPNALPCGFAELCGSILTAAAAAKAQPI